MAGESGEVEAKAQRPRDPSKRTLLWNIGWLICRLYTTLMFELKVYGRRHVPAKGGVLIVSNHQSYLDPVLLGVGLSRPMSYMARATLWKNKLFGWLITNLNAFPVRRGEGDIGAVKETIRRLQEGHMLAMFPEGTRTMTGDIEAMEPGVALMIRRAGVTVVPAVVDGSYQAWPKGVKFPRAHPIRVLYGPALNTQGLRASEIMPMLERTLKGMLADLRAGKVEKYK